MIKGKPLRAAAIVAALAGLAIPTGAHAQLQSRISGLSDVNYGTINAFVDQTNSQNVCVYSSFTLFGFPLVQRPYSVVATGSGAGGAFTIASGPRTLPYEVRWADAANQTTGTLLTAGVTASGFTGSNNSSCGGSENASLIVTITGPSLASASAGSYSGVLSITIVPN